MRRSYASGAGNYGACEERLLVSDPTLSHKAEKSSAPRTRLLSQTYTIFNALHPCIIVVPQEAVHIIWLNIYLGLIPCRELFVSSVAVPRILEITIQSVTVFPLIPYICATFWMPGWQGDCLQFCLARLWTSPGINIRPPREARRCILLKGCIEIRLSFLEERFDAFLWVPLTWSALFLDIENF
jgi:hypothetical protein